MSDEYYTPRPAWELLRPYIPKDKVVWECAWGTGQLAGWMRADGYKVIGGPGVDFLTTSLECDAIITNPPYSLTRDFLLRVQALGKPFAFLLPSEKLVPRSYHSIFEDLGMELLIPDKRINFNGPNCKGKAPAAFPTLWYCHRILPEKLIFKPLPLSTSGNSTR